ncbi:DUF1146 family protein [Paenibacillus xerothermodurans]|uniref:DUF1146 domain-containing protein n=1 Tax=Paenibacillus xerothermodurans TaxID=1977292 RepID=A0A2W1N4V4_PAEXE|nr:DUF1146 domain-containing protein [Paenibacillus xerothermodurans]PZE19387.1 DUF1146 domain-containing protein [Paenibacillus xerothermodurans]
MDYVDQMNASMGMNGLLNIVIVLICIGGSWWALQELNFGKLLKRPKSVQSTLLQILLSVSVGYQAARFIIDYYHWSTWIGGMF